MFSAMNNHWSTKWMESFSIVFSEESMETSLLIFSSSEIAVEFFQLLMIVAYFGRTDLRVVSYDNIFIEICIWENNIIFKYVCIMHWSSSTVLKYIYENSRM